MTKPIIDPAAVKRLNEAAEWFFYLKDAQPTEAELAEWTAWCERDPKNLKAFEGLKELWRDPYFREAYAEQMAMLERDRKERGSEES